LNDHLAGSVAALELLERLRKLSSGSERQQLFLSLRQEIEEDQQVVKDLLRSVGGKESKLRNAAAWLGEKVGEAKLELDNSGNGQLRLLEGLEALGLGIQGKAGLWRALSAVSTQEPEIRKLNLAQLERRAYAQFERVEVQRIQAAREAFGL
jgi:hypothetical protein